ncbi:MAG TPA: S41 family peptidase [Allosphingosinicella sp.]|nr:S41 family peptidase [Allosphingosinicella sp.]
MFSPALLVPLALLAAAPCVAAAAAAPHAAPAPEAQRRRLAVFDLVWTEIGEKYYDPALNGADWPAVRARYRPLAEEAADDEALHTLLRRMTGELRDAHTRVMTPEQALARRRDESASTGVILFEVEGRPVVFDVRPDTPAAAAGLRPGMAVLAVNGVPIAEALGRAHADVGPSSSGRAAAVLAYLRLIAGPAGEPLRLDLANADGSRRNVVLPRLVRRTAPRFEARRLDSGALYVRFDRIDAPVARLFRAALKEHRDAPGLILDLRSNPGGDGREGARVVAPLLDRPTLIARLRTRTGRAPSALLGLVRLPLELKAGEAGAQLFANPVAILVNEGTGSTSEVIAAALQERRRAIVVGARSCGCALGVLRHRRLATGASLAISEVGLLSGMGRRIEGEGVVPDVAAAPSLSDLRQGRDAMLEAAVAALQRPPRPYGP